MNIAFDIGNVLLHYDLDIFCKEMVEQGLTNYNDAKLFIIEHEHLSYIGATHLKKQLLIKFKNITEEKIEILLNKWNETIYPNQQMINFMVDLKNMGVKIALLSNMGLDHAKHIEDKYPELFKNNICHLSYEVGMFKPNKLFYQSFLLEHEDFWGCVYLDDLMENIIIGSKFKFNSIHFDLNKISKENPLIFKRKLEEIKEKVINST